MAVSLLSLICLSVPPEAGPLAFLGAPVADRMVLFAAFGLLAAWIFLCDWMARDVPWVGADGNLWFGLAMGVGLLGFLLMILLPSAGASLTGWALLIGGQGVAYVIYRNAIVPPHLRVLTPEWFKNLFAGKLGSRFGDSRFTDKAPVDMKWMDGPSQIHDPPEDPDFRHGFDQSSILLFGAVNRRATDVTVAPDKDGKYSVKVVIDGFTNTDKPLDRNTVAHMLLWIKQTGGMDLSEHRKPQKGKMTVMVGKKKVDLLAETRGSTAGEEMSVHVMDRSALRKLNELGMTTEVLEKYRKVVELPRGLFLVGGPAGGGLTSTLYALLREHDLFQLNVATVEDPVYMELENLSQTEYDSQGGKTSYAKAVQTLYRGRDPDVLMLGKSDTETLPLAAQIAERKKVYAALECTSAIEGLGKVIKAVGDGELVTRAVIGVGCQKLIRVLCSECKVSYKPPADALRRLNVPADRVNELYRPPAREEITPAGKKQKDIICPRCQGTGYFGQTGVFELLVMSDAIREMVRSGSPLKDIQMEARKEKMLYLHEQILKKVIDGVTGVDELMRVVQGTATPQG
jgi:type II secretory ATPase GspE/PulE/Tfp pilus assembly ATPase PilB-like protein